MDRKDKHFYPANPETIHKYALSIFSPVRRGECVTAVWVSMSGRRMWNRFIIENIDLFDKELPDEEKYLLVYIEPLDLTEENLAGYLRLMGKGFLNVCQANNNCKKIFDNDPALKVFDEESSSYPKLLEGLNKCLRKAAQSEMEVVFFLGEFDELHKFANSVFYNNLKSLWDSLKPHLHYVFLTVEDLSSPEITERFGELNAATLENVIYVPIRQGKDIDYLLDFFSERLGSSLGENEREVIIKLCGGHPYLIKAATKVAASTVRETGENKDLEKNLSSHYELLSVSRRIFNLRSNKEKEIIKRIALGEKVELSEDLGRLIKLGLVEVAPNEKYKLFGELFSLIAAQSDRESTSPKIKEKSPALSINTDGVVVINGGTPIEEKFTAQEYNVLRFLLNSQGKLESREKISEILWGAESYEKYSDWAIDQLMSKLRKKLKELDARSELVTVRGRGYKLVSE